MVQVVEIRRLQVVALVQGVDYLRVRRTVDCQRLVDRTAAQVEARLARLAQLPADVVDLDPATVATLDGGYRAQWQREQQRDVRTNPHEAKICGAFGSKGRSL